MIGILTGTSADGNGEPIPLGGKVSLVGRGDECTVLVADRSVSRQHAQIERDDGGYHVQDLDSRNGTTVNGIAIVRKRLRHNDVIRFGDVEFVFQESDEQPVRPDTRAKKPSTGAGMANREGMTIGMAAPGGGLAGHTSGGAVEAWKTIQQFASGTAEDLENILERIAGDLAGVAAVAHVLLYLPRGIAAKGERFIRRGRSKAPSIEERMRMVVEKGVPLFMKNGRAVPRGADPCTVETAFIPLLLPDDQAGCLVLEARDNFSPTELDLAESVAAAMEIGCRLRLPGPPDGRRQPGSAGDSRTGVEIVGRSPALQEVIRQARKAARADSTVLIRGETGTGKELIARLIYEESARKGKPFLRVNISSIQPDLMTDELFGHVKGAFSDAVADRKGYFEEADGGTLFLDEIGELAPDVQVKLLRVMQEGEFMRLGSNTLHKADVRLIAATNRNLEAEVKKGTFRQDLYYRLHVIEINLPPLRARAEDIPNLVQYFIERYRRRANSPVRSITSAAMEALQQFNWRGNIRELQNVIERAMVLGESAEIDAGDLQLAPASLFATVAGSVADAGKRPLRTLEEVERDHIALVLSHCKNNMSEAARILGISRSALYAKTGRASDAAK